MTLSSKTRRSPAAVRFHRLLGTPFNPPRLGFGALSHSSGALITPVIAAARVAVP